MPLLSNPPRAPSLPTFSRPPSIPEELYENCVDTIDLMNACNYPDNAKQLKMLAKVAATLIELRPHIDVVITHNKLREGCFGTRNKNNQDIGRRYVALDPAMTSLIMFCEEMGKKRRINHDVKEARARDEKQTLLADVAAAKEKEKEEKSKKSKTKARSRLSSPLSLASFLLSDIAKNTSPELVPSSEDESMQGEEDDPMFDATDVLWDYKLTVCSQAEASSSIIDIDAPPKTSVKGPIIASDTDFLVIKGPTKARAEVIMIPYIQNRFTNYRAPAYLKAVDIVRKTNPSEFAKVLAATPSSVPRKRRNGSSKYHFDEADAISQGDQALRPATLSSAVANTQTNVDYALPFHITNEALLNQERDVRTKMDTAGHSLLFEYRVHQVLMTEHKRLMGELKDRDLKPIDNGQPVNNVAANWLFRSDDLP
ncbi:hypothetical protein FB451DRAFT_1171344 [Mycena latifolia]|nr:hypothetical protein FB451DRAFT_1171344 [Mycena latifolia]